MPTRRMVGAALALAWVATSAHAGAVQDAAEKVRAAAEDDAALRALAEETEPDPWRVADALQADGDGELALRFARLAPADLNAELPAYLERTAGDADLAAQRDRLARIGEPWGADDWAGVLEVTEGLGETTGTVPGIRLHVARAWAFAQTGEHRESAAHYRVAARGAHAIGWRTKASETFRSACDELITIDDYTACIGVLEEQLAADELRHSPPHVLQTLNNLGYLKKAVGDLEGALEAFRRRRDVAREAGDADAEANALSGMAGTYQTLGDNPAAEEHHRQALEAFRELGDRRGEVTTLGNLAILRRRRGDLAGAVEMMESCARVWEELGERDDLAVAHINLGVVKTAMGNVTEGLDHYEKALALLEDGGDERLLTMTLTRMTGALVSAGRLRRAREVATRAYELCERRGEKRGLAGAVDALGKVALAESDLDGAVAHYRHALALYEEMSMGGEAASTGLMLGAIEQRLGRYASALRRTEEALACAEELGLVEVQSNALRRLANLHGAMGRDEEALALSRRALEIAPFDDVPLRRANVLDDLASWQRMVGRDDEALALAEESLALRREHGDAVDVANGEIALARVLDDLGEADRALALAGSACDAFREAGKSADVADAEYWLGLLRIERGDLDAALEHAGRALEAATEIRSTGEQAWARHLLARVHHARGEHADAVAETRAAVGLLRLQLAGLDETSAAGRRRRMNRLFRPGVLSAFETGDVAAAVELIESGRAMTLVEALGGRERVRAAAIPQDLLQAEGDARLAVAEAERAFHDALADGDRGAVSDSRTALDAARQDLVDAAARVDRSARLATDLVYPDAAELDEIRAALGPADALVLYELWADGSFAVVVTRDGARIAPLPGKSDVRAAADLRLDDPEADVADVIARQRAALIDPLALPEGVRRVLISSDSRVGYVPFCALLPEHEVAFVPSGTTYVRLRERGVARGEGVLAFGDPAYRVAPAASGAVALRSGETLVRIPATADEARAVGTVVRLGDDATETALVETLASERRWRSVHLACHGLIDPVRPAFCSLALTPDAENDGFLTALEVMRLDVRADLAVLSACDTARGRVVAGEGLFGLARAFLIAGTPRVVVSTWKVDDAATRALMERFYARMDAGEAPAAALRGAQHDLRTGDERFRHPRHWAAWVLWGLPD